MTYVYVGKIRRWHFFRFVCVCVYTENIEGVCFMWGSRSHWQDTGGSPPRLTTLTAPGCSDKEQLLLGLRCKESPRCPQVHLKADFLTVYCLALPVPVNFTRRCFTSSERESEGGWDRRKRKTFIDFYATTTLIVPKWKALSLTCHAWPTPTSRSFWPISPHSLDRFQPQRGSWHKNHTDMLRLRSCLDFSPVINKKKKKRPTGSSRWLILTNPEHANNYDSYVNSFAQSRKCPTAIFVNASNCCSS